MTSWRKYIDLESIRRLRNEGRELIGKEILLTEKRDGENVSMWLNDKGEPQVSSHNLKVASPGIISRLVSTPEYERGIELLRDEYNPDLIAYGELLKGTSPTRIEPRKKHIHWVLFDVFDCAEERYVGYNKVYQLGHHFKIPVVRVVDRFIPNTIGDLKAKIEEAKKWCRRHRREGVVGKNYKEQIFFKEKIDLPNLPKLRKPSQRPQLPAMPEERILRALMHAFDEVGEKDWLDKRIAMPMVAKHFNVEGREHNFSPPRNMYYLYLNTPIEKLRERGSEP